MIKFSMRCEDSHRFDSWFQSNDAYDKLRQTNMLTCPMCGTCRVEKNIMAPRINSTDAPNAHDEASVPVAEKIELREPTSKLEKAIMELKREIEKTSEYVGRRFVEEARAINAGASPKRSIHGEADVQDAKELIEEGVYVLPLPWQSAINTN